MLADLNKCQEMSTYIPLDQNETVFTTGENREGSQARVGIFSAVIQ